MNEIFMIEVIETASWLFSEARSRRRPLVVVLDEWSDTAPAWLVELVYDELGVSE